MLLLEIDELRTLAEQSDYPSISLYMPTQQKGTEVRQNSIRFKNLLRQAEALLKNDDRLQDLDVSAFLEPLAELDRDDFWQHQSAGLAIFLKENLLRYYQLPLDFEELVIVSEHFHLKPMLPLLTNDGEFYLLALSQQEIRLFQGSRYDIHEIELEGIPKNLDEALKYDETSKAGQFRISTSRGGTRNSFQKAGTFHGQGSPDQDKPQTDILQFFHILDGELQQYFDGKQIPLVLAGVEYLLPLYQEANSYAHLMDTIIPIENVGVFDPNDVHAEAWSVVEPFYSQSQEAAIEQYYELAGTGKTSTDLKETIAAAYYGRVDQLFVAVGIHKWGNFDPQANQLQIHSDIEPGDEDLLSAAAVKTALNGGTVYAVEPEKVPEQAPLAAVFRY